MGRGKKGKQRGFDKKNATTFVVLSRGKDDPESDSPNILVPVPPPNLKGAAWEPEFELESYSEDEVSDEEWEYEKKQLEIGEYGLPLDGYDYSQHFAPMGGGKFLRAIPQKGRAKKGAEVKEAAPEDDDAGDVALEAEVAPEEMDPELQEMLAEAVTDDEDWQLQDDFVLHAMGHHQEEEDDGDSEEMRDPRVKQFEARSGTGIMDEWVDTLEAREYGNARIGEGLSDEDEQALDVNSLDWMMQDYLEEKEHRKEKYEKVEDDDKEIALLRTKQLIDTLDDYTEQETEYMTKVIKTEWDCESVLSTLSNIYNHPNKIQVARRAHRERVAAPQPAPGFLDVEQAKEEEERLEREQAQVEPVNKGESRKRNETAEEKRARKAAVKEERRIARYKKKQLKQAYRGEKLLQDKQEAGATQGTTMIKM